MIRPIDPNFNGLVVMTTSSDQFVAETAQTMREGSKMPRADWKQMQQFSVIVPPPAILSSFNEAISNITQQLRTLTFQNQKLRAARDLLLPPLISGEITV